MKDRCAVSDAILVLIDNGILNRSLGDSYIPYTVSSDTKKDFFRFYTKLENSKCDLKANIGWRES